MRKLILGTTAIVAATTLTVATVKAETTVHTKTYIENQDIENAEAIQFSEFDLNKDGLYAKSEVGEKLFYVFDKDGNEVIDNIEWGQENFLTITPMEKRTYTFVDYDSDGYTELSSYSYEVFYKESGLIRFDQDRDGLSAEEFIEEGYQSLDDNDNGMIEIDEWKEAYTKKFAPENAEQERYNN